MINTEDVGVNATTTTTTTQFFSDTARPRRSRQPPPPIYSFPLFLPPHRPPAAACLACVTSLARGDAPPGEREGKKRRGRRKKQPLLPRIRGRLLSPSPLTFSTPHRLAGSPSRHSLARPPPRLLPSGVFRCWRYHSRWTTKGRGGGGGAERGWSEP